MHFAFPEVLDGPISDTLARVKQALARRDVPLSIHGPFYDMATGSVDEAVNALCRRRFTQAIEAADAVGARRMVVHANFIATIRNGYYRVGWHQRNVDFWGDFALTAARLGISVLIENMWEFEPQIIANLLRDINHPLLGACLDVGHAAIFSDSDITLPHWLDLLSPWLTHYHLNNNNGKFDEHHGFDYDDGVLDYHAILPQLRKVANPTWMVLEMDSVDDMRASLPYFEL
ncbi:MAG: sugar phosphate isomerase/epimerase [Chloroflexi bacterium]|nr:sugar phosphate isomerase/epimerase [Chloroflexota bacterium]